MGFYLLVLLFVKANSLLAMMCRGLNAGTFCRLEVWGGGYWEMGSAKFGDFMAVLSLNFGTYCDYYS